MLSATIARAQQVTPADTTAGPDTGQTEAAPAPPPPPPPLVTPANGRSIKIEGIVQFQGATSSVDSTVDFDTELRRMRVTADGDAGGGFSGRLMLDFDSNRARVQDAFGEYKASPAFTVRVGQFKPPFNVIELVSAKRLLLIERGIRIRGVRTTTTSNFLADAHYAARNRGVMATLKPTDRLTLQAGGWLGSGEAGEDNDGKEFGGRIEYSVLELPEKTSKPLSSGWQPSRTGSSGAPGTRSGSWRATA